MTTNISGFTMLVYTNVPLVVTNAFNPTNVPIHVLPVVQQAQDQLSQWIVMIIPVIVPLLIDYLKKTFPNVPSWALPSLAPVLGAFADVLLQASGVQTGGAVKGALLGSAGVGLRELANQITQTLGKPPTPPLPPAPEPPKPDVANPPKAP